MTNSPADLPSCHSSDHAALRDDVVALLPDLRGFARFLARDRTAADDLVQDTIVRALHALPQFMAGNSLRGWLFSILRNMHYEQARRRRTEQRVLAETSFAHPSDAQAVPAQHGQAALSELQRFLWTLPAALREALVLVGAQGLSYAEAAVVCGVAEGTVKARVSRARTLLAMRMAMPAAPSTRLPVVPPDLGAPSD